MGFSPISSGLFRGGRGFLPVGPACFVGTFVGTAMSFFRCFVVFYGRRRGFLLVGAAVVSNVLMVSELPK